MAQLYFRYSTMNAGKSTEILKIAHNYEEQNKHVLLFTPALDDRFGRGQITSRMGFQREAQIIDAGTDMLGLAREAKPDCLLVDEGQFLTRAQVILLTRIVDELNHGRVVVVAGFQGVGDDLDVTTLGREARTPPPSPCHRLRPEKRLPQPPLQRERSAPPPRRQDRGSESRLLVLHQEGDHAPQAQGRPAGGRRPPDRDRRQRQVHLGLPQVLRAEAGDQVDHRSRAGRRRL